VAIDYVIEEIGSFLPINRPYPYSGAGFGGRCEATRP